MFHFPSPLSIDHYQSRASRVDTHSIIISEPSKRKKPRDDAIRNSEFARGRLFRGTYFAGQRNICTLLRTPPGPRKHSKISQSHRSNSIPSRGSPCNRVGSQNGFSTQTERLRGCIASI